MKYIENKIFDEIKIGDSAELEHTLTKKDIDVFAVMSGDVNPTHIDKEFAQSDLFHRIVAQGMWGGALISNVLGTDLPGPGAVYLSQTLSFKKQISIGDKVIVKVVVKEKDYKKKEITFFCSITNQKNEEVTSGTAIIIAPTKKIRRPRIELGEVVLRRSGELYEDLLKIRHKVKPVKTAVIHPVDNVSLLGVIESAEAKIIVPILIGPEHKIQAIAKNLKIDLSPYEIISTPHSHAAAELGVSLARKGEVDAIMKGALHTDELMHAVIDKDTGISTERRMSHVFVMEIPTYPRLMLVSDAAINIDPNLDEKKDITQNAIDLAHDIGIKIPKVAIISAIETITSKIQSTLDAAALCKMADRGQIKGGILDGPLAFDNVVSKEAADIKGITSPVAGCADIIIVPDLVSGNILVKQLEYLSDAQSAGVVLGAKVPIILTSRSDTDITRLASSALASIIVYQKLTSREKKS
jgi:phosphotransacetylase/acyl dehydratase